MLLFMYFLQINLNLFVDYLQRVKHACTQNSWSFHTKHLSKFKYQLNLLRYNLICNCILHSLLNFLLCVFKIKSKKSSGFFGCFNITIKTYYIQREKGIPFTALTTLSGYIFSMTFSIIQITHNAHAVNFTPCSECIQGTVAVYSKAVQ